jgi:hypothetical protein
MLLCLRFSLGLLPASFLAVTNDESTSTTSLRGYYPKQSGKMKHWIASLSIRNDGGDAFVISRNNKKVIIPSRSDTVQTIQSPDIQPYPIGRNGLR